MLKEENLSYKIRGCVFEVYRQLGHGFLEKVYERALLKELQLQGLKAQSQVPVKVDYKGDPVGEFFVDIIVEDKIIIELKAQERLSTASEAQILNYLKASSIKLGLLVNFTHPKAIIKRFVL